MINGKHHTYFTPGWVREDFIVNSKGDLLPLNLFLNLQLIGSPLAFINGRHNHHIPELTRLWLSPFEWKKWREREGETRDLFFFFNLFHLKVLIENCTQSPKIILIFLMPVQQNCIRHSKLVMFIT